MSRKPEPVQYGLSATAIGNVFYVIGGYNGAYLPITEAYDAESNSWTEKAWMPTGLAYPSVVAVNGALYAIGGWTGTASVGTVGLRPPAHSRMLSTV